MTILSHIQQLSSQGKHQWALLIDPEKPIAIKALAQTQHQPDYILVGGSTGEQVEECILDIRQVSSRPILLFPGSEKQFSPLADGLLLLSVLNSQDPNLLAGQHIHSARDIKHSGIEVLPMGYILIDGGCETSVVRTTHTKPYPQNHIDTITNTAIAAQLLGKQLVYLEAGSGAITPVRPEVIQAVKNQLDIPLLVGGGICHSEQIMTAYQAGADIIVIGNHMEQHPEDIEVFGTLIDSMNKQ